MKSITVNIPDNVHALLKKHLLTIGWATDDATIAGVFDAFVHYSIGTGSDDFQEVLLMEFLNEMGKGVL